MNKKVITEALGWYGVVALLGAYTLVSFGLLTANDVWFQTLNVTGSIGIVIKAFAQEDWQPAVLNIIWAIVGLVVLFKILI